MATLKVQRSLRLSRDDWEKLIASDVKLQMMRQKFELKGSLGEWINWRVREDVMQWLADNTSDFWYVPEMGSADDLTILFLAEKDVVNFKMAWDGLEFNSDEDF